MKNFNTEKKILESIEKIILDLIDFSNCNTFDFNLYKSFADECSKSFNRYFFKIEDQAVKVKIISDLKTDFLFSIDNIVTESLSQRNKIENPEPGVTYHIGKPIRDERIRDFENNYRKIKDLFFNGIDTETIKNSSNPFQETETPLDKIRNNNYSNLELITILKRLSNNYESELLRALLKDIDFYLFVEKEEMECEFSSLEIENAIQKLIENNIEIPYIKRTPFEKLTDKGKKFATRLRENGFTDTPTLNKEQLLFPYEFFEIYRFKNLINSKLNELTPIEPVPEKKPAAPKNDHPKYFINNGFELFEYILNNHIAENRGRINDISFYYWKMFNDEYIIQNPFPFVEWFAELYNVESFQIKTLKTTTNTNRLKHYSNSLDWFKSQNQ